MKVYGSFPGVRMRRMRRDDFSRRLMRETTLGPGDLIYPVFVLDGKNRTEGGFHARGRTLHRRQAATGGRGVPEARRSRARAFSVIDAKLKSTDGREAFNPKGLVPRALAALKKRFPGSAS